MTVFVFVYFWLCSLAVVSVAVPGLFLVQQAGATLVTGCGLTAVSSLVCPAQALGRMIFSSGSAWAQ